MVKYRYNIFGEESDMKIIRQDVEFDHKGKVFPARLDTYLRNSGEGYVINFTYNSVSVNVSFEEDEATWWHLAIKHCELIDKLGERDYKIYCDYNHKLKRIKKEKIVVENNVYNFFYKEIDGGHVTYYMMSIGMSDGETIHGNPRSDFFDKDKYDKKKTFNNLSSRVKEYYRNNGVIPEDKYLNSELTEKFREMKEWINNIE